MSTVVADLIARVRSEGVQQASTDVKAFGAEATQTARALEIMAAAMAKSKDFGGSAAQALEVLHRSGAQPTAAAMAAAAQSAERMASAVQQAAGASRAFSVSPAMAALENARSGAEEHRLNAARAEQQKLYNSLIQQAAGPTQAVAKATEEVGKGWNASESSLVRFGAALVGVNLGISLVAGAARLVHDAIEGIVVSQLDWERSLKNLSGLYGQTGAQAAALATAQSNLPGVLGTQQEFAQAAIDASALRLRYGLSQQVADQLITTGGRLAYATGMTDPAARAQLQQQILAAVQTGAPLPVQYGVYTDPEAVARRLGTPGAQSLGAYTPQELMTARSAIVSSGLNQFTDRAAANQRGALDAVTAAEKATEQARTNMQNALEGAGGAGGVQPVAGILAAENQAPYSALTRERRAALGLPDVAGPSGAGNFVDYEGNARTLAASQATYAAALADSTKAQEDARKTLDTLARSVDAAGAKLFSFFGSLENTMSISHGDILAQAQGAVTARARSAIPVVGMGAAEIAAMAAGTSAQQAWQNFVAPLAQQEQTNVIQRNLERLANPVNPTPDRNSGAQQTAAQRALVQLPQLTQINARMNEAQQTGALVDIATAETQAKLQTISLTQQERQIQLIRETVDLRRLDVQQQQALNAATQNVIRAQQSGLASSWALSDAQYQGNLASSLAQQRMGRTLRGQDVSGLPSIDQLIQMNVNAQFATAEAGPAALQGARGVEMAQRTATSAGLAQELTAGQLQSADLANDLKNLADIPSQTGLQLELVGYGRDSLAVQKELRDLTKDLVRIMTGRPPSATSDQGMQDLSSRLADLIFGDGSSDIAIPAPSDLPGARRGPS